MIRRFAVAIGALVVLAGAGCAAPGPTPTPVATPLTVGLGYLPSVQFAQFYRADKQGYYRDARLCYAEGWSINYFFMQSPVAKSKGYPQIPVRMLEALKTGGGGEDGWQRATDKAFAGIDLKKMEEEWKAFVVALPIPKSQMDKGDDDSK